MGLDSVELLVSFENYFNIQVSDLEAEKIYTVQNMIDCVSKHLGITNTDSKLKMELFNKLKHQLIKSELADSNLTISNTIFNILKPDDLENWNKISKNIELNIPKPYIEPENKAKKLFYSINWKPKYNWKDITIEQFITAIYAYNFEKIINSKSINNKYEIFIAIIAITVDKIGVDFYEVQPEKSFVNDFGID